MLYSQVFPQQHNLRGQLYENSVMEPNELVKPTEDEHIFSSLSSAAAILETQSIDDLRTPDVVDLLKGDL